MCKKPCIFQHSRHKEWHKELLENVEKQAKTVETVEIIKNSKHSNNMELRQW